MNRYEDNTSPQPTINSSNSYNNTYVTPKNAYVSQSVFPTPPSDDDTQDTYYQNKYYNHNATDNTDSSSIISPELSLEIDASKNRFKRRSRTTFTKHQIDILETTFQKTHYPDLSVVDRLSQVLHLATERISIWFQNRRARHKKERKLQQAENKKQIELQALQQQQQQNQTTLSQPWTTYSTNEPKYNYSQTHASGQPFQNITNLTKDQEQSQVNDPSGFALFNHFYSNFANQNK